MEYWVGLFISVVMVILGIWFVKSPPKRINVMVGYRSAMSRKNMDTWIFAHNYFGKNILRAGGILVCLSTIALIFLSDFETGVMVYTGWAIIAIQVLTILVLFIVTDTALKRNFDSNGNRRKT